MGAKNIFPREKAVIQTSNMDLQPDGYIEYSSLIGVHTLVKVKEVRLNTGIFLFLLVRPSRKGGLYKSANKKSRIRETPTLLTD